jgi:hypothetical protein
MHHLAVLWTDVGSRDLSLSREYHRFISHMAADTQTGHRDIRLLSVHMLGMESVIKHPWPLPLDDSSDLSLDDGSLVQRASHLPSELHLMADDHVIAGQDPYMLSRPYCYPQCQRKTSCCQPSKDGTTSLRRRNGIENMMKDAESTREKSSLI